MKVLCQRGPQAPVLECSGRGHADQRGWQSGPGCASLLCSLGRRPSHTGPSWGAGPQPFGLSPC